MAPLTGDERYRYVFFCSFSFVDNVSASQRQQQQMPTYNDEHQRTMMAGMADEGMGLGKHCPPSSDVRFFFLFLRFLLY